MATKEPDTEPDPDPDPESEELPDYLNKAAEMIKKATECESEEQFDESVLTK